MSLCQQKVCCLVLREHFGELAEEVGNILTKKGSCNLRQIATESNVELKKVKRILVILIHHNIVKFETSKKGWTEYMLDVDTLLWRLRIPHYIHCSKTLYGDGAELVIEDILHHGQSTMSQVVETVTDRLNEALENAGHSKISPSVVYEKFTCLAQTHFIKQQPNPLEEVDQQDERGVSKLFDVPPLTQDRKRKINDDTAAPSAKKAKLSGNQSSDDGIYWKINTARFHQYFRDQCFIKAMTKKIDKRAGAILQTMLRLSEVKTDDLAFTSYPMSLTEIFQALPRDQGITRQLCEQYLSIMADDSMNFVSRVGDSGGGMFVINIMQALQSLCEAHIESVVQERFGSKSLRIFRVLLIKRHLEQKQIEEMAMIPAKEAKELLYIMFAQNFLTITEISKTPDHAPARTYYLFRVHVVQLARMLLENCYKALSNAMIKREAETKENRRLMEKQERVDAILASLEQAGADEAQKEEILQTITPAEKTQLNKVKHLINMLEQCELQLDETIFILETFLYYHDQKQKLKL